MTAEHVRVEFAEAIVAITLDRPAKLNALTPAMMSALGDALATAGEDDVRAVVLLGAGRSFCAGADVESGLGITDATRAHAFLSGLADVLAAISALAKPVIVGMQGHAVGGGAELALEADLRIVADDAALSFPDVAIGSTPASVYQLVRHVGKSLATEMVMLGTSLSATEMKRLRLATDVVTPAQLRDATMDLARAVRDRAGARSLRFGKEAVQIAEHPDRRADLRVNVAAMLACQGAAEQRAYVASFPRRQGR
jgi:enoyl-CoA hydratase/carnithine racemase